MNINQILRFLKNSKKEVILLSELKTDVSMKEINNLILANNLNTIIIDDLTEIYDVELDAIELNEKKLNSISKLDRLYLNEISSYPLLSIEETNSLFSEIEKARILEPKLSSNLSKNELNIIKIQINKAKRAKEKLIQCNMKICAKIAFKYIKHTNFLTLTDLINEGYFGLSKAVDSYKSVYHTKFATYAYYWVNQTITRAYYNKDRVIRLPIHISNKISAYKKAYVELYQLNSCAPSDELLCDKLHWNKQLLNHIRTVADGNEGISRPTRLDKEVVKKGLSHILDDSDITFGDMVKSNDKNADRLKLESKISEDIKNIMKQQLSPRSYSIICRRYLNFKTETLDEIGADLHLTRERIRQIEAAALKRLRCNSNIVEMFNVLIANK